MLSVRWDAEVKLLFGNISGIAGAHTQAATFDELWDNLGEVLELLGEQGEPINSLGSCTLLTPRQGRLPS